MTLAVILSAILLSIAALHVLWGIGYWMPINEEAALARAVAGFAGIEKMPGPVPCALVAVALLMAAASLWWPHGLWRTCAMALIAAVFLLRGLAPFTIFWRKLTQVEPFATLDRRYYGPLCLALGLGFVSQI